MPPAGYKPSVLASEQPQTLALNRSTTGIGKDCTQQEKQHCTIIKQRNLLSYPQQFNVQALTAVISLKQSRG
jgi:hypothetical protein